MSLEMESAMLVACSWRRASSCCSAASYTIRPTGTASAPNTTRTMAMVEMTRRRRTSSSGSGLAFESEADAAHGDDQLRRIRVVADLATERRDVRVERPRRAPVVLVPHGGHDLLARERGVGATHQQRQQVELLRRQFELGAVEVGATRFGVDPQRPAREFARH